MKIVKKTKEEKLENHFKQCLQRHLDYIHSFPDLKRKTLLLHLAESTVDFARMTLTLLTLDHPEETENIRKQMLNKIKDIDTSPQHIINTINEVTDKMEKKRIRQELMKK